MRHVELDRASSDCSRPVNNYVHVKTADLYRPNARLTPERQGYQVLTPFGKLGYSPQSGQSEGGQGNGGKAYLRQLFDKGYFISICDGQLSVVGFADVTKWWLRKYGLPLDHNITIVRGGNPEEAHRRPAPTHGHSTVSTGEGDSSD